MPLGCEGRAILRQQTVDGKRSAIGADTWNLCNQIVRRRKTTILFQHTILLRNPDGAARENGLIPFPNNRLQRLLNICFFLTLL